MNQETLHQFLKLSTDNDGQVVFRVHDKSVEYPPNIGWLVEFRYISSSSDFIPIEDIMKFNKVVKNIGDDAYLIIDKPKSGVYSLSIGLRFFSRTVAQMVHKAFDHQSLDGLGVFDLRANKWMDNEF